MVSKVSSSAYHGFSYAVCQNEKCGQGYVVPFSCKTGICPSCGEKQVLEFSDWLINEVLFNVKHKHTVLTMPEETREYFRKEPKLLSYLAHSAGKMLIRLARLSAAGKWSNYKNLRKIPEDAKPGIIIRIETAGGNLCWNPHFHCIETEGCYNTFGTS